MLGLIEYLVTERSHHHSFYFHLAFLQDLMQRRTKDTNEQPNKHRRVVTNSIIE